MSETLNDMMKRLGLSAPQVLKQVRRLRDRLLSRHMLAQQLFTGPDGEPTPAAAAWLKQLAAENYVNRSTFHREDREQVRREARRELALEIIASARLDVERLNSLKELEREME